MLLNDDDFGLEPCSMWASFMNAGLHFSRVNLDLTPLTQVPQYSVHVAAGDRQTGGSVILNTWAPQDQNLSEISSNLQLLRQEDQEAVGNEPPTPDTWLEQALKEAIAHIIEPPQDPSGSAWRLISAKKGYDEGRTNSSVATVVNAATSTSTSTTTTVTTQPRSTCKIVFILADPESSFRRVKHEDGDTEMEGEEEEGWFYGRQDIRRMVYEAVRNMEISIKKRNVNIHVDLIRIATSQSQARGDIIMEQISRTCTASVYTVISQDELSPVQALTNYFLLQNTDVKVLRVRDTVFTEKFGKEAAELFYRSDHIVPTTFQMTDAESEQDSNMSILQQTPSSVQNAIDTDHAQEYHTHQQFESGMPQRTTELTPDPVKGRTVPKDDRSQREDSVMTDDSATTTNTSVSDIMKRPLLGKTATPVVQDFINAIVRPNLVKSKMEWGGGGFIELTPPALKTTAAVQFKAKGGGGGGVKSHARKDQGTVGVDMAVVHSTKRLDLETRWLVQWQGERVHPIMPEHRVLLEQFRSVICNAVVASIEPITTILEKLIADARPAVLPGMVAIPENLPPTQLKIIQQAVQTTQQIQQDPAVRESAKAILADLWMVGQRFKSISPSHAAVAKEIGEMVAPTGLDYNTVKLTYIAPVLRAFQQAKEIDPTLVASLPDGGSPNLNQGQGQGMMGNNTWGGRGGGNVGGGGRGGRGGMQGGARFGDNNNNRNNANRRGGFGGPGGGNAGGFRNNGGGMGSGANANTASNNTEEILMDSSLPLVSMSGRTQPVPYLETTPPTREEIDSGDQAYLSELGEEGSLLRTYWGPRGAQGSSVAAIVNSMNSLDSTTLLEPSGPGAVLAVPPMGTGQDLASIHAAALKRLKRPRLQDFAGRTPVKEYGGFSKA
ncbi:hypothetical protein EC991_001741 [Linnemannia zychae]|nr:hypothetical protein EC991_001741 [Linnemannia zychae]